MPVFYFSRLSLKTEVNYIDKAQFLLDGINSRAEVTYRQDNFKLLNGEIVKVGSKIYVVGKMVKYKPVYEEEVIIANQSESLEIQNKVLAAVRFIIDPESSVIIYEEHKSHIPKDSFPYRFVELFKLNYNERISDMVIEALAEDYSFFKRVEEVAEIKRIEIRLTPSNPNNSDMWDDIDDDLNERQLTNYREVQENKRKGQGIIIDENTKKKFYMSEDGYGKSTVKGYKHNGTPITVSTKDKAEQAKESIPNSVQEVLDQINELQDKLNDLIKRTKEREV